MIQQSNITQTTVDLIIDGITPRLQLIARRLGFKNINFCEDKIELSNDTETIIIQVKKNDTKRTNH
jgi:hypothetical protein